MIQIVNWLLTRRCNLRCDYCSLVTNYEGKPSVYPNMGQYHNNEMSTEYVLQALDRLKKHNPYSFNIFYGGEPTLRTDLADIVNYCNANEIYYTIITNNTDEVQPLLEKLFLNVDKVAGLTSSVDPIIYSEDEDTNSDRVKKSFEGLRRLKLYGDVVDDVVAEITIDKNNYKYIYMLVKQLTEHNISSSITAIDVAKSPYYDFSNIHDDELLVNWTEELDAEIQKILKDDSLDIHMKNVILPRLVDTLPSNLDCRIEKEVHNITIDADGSVRLCLRIRGVMTPNFDVLQYIDINGEEDPSLKGHIRIDKQKYCHLCNWTCMIMSKYIAENRQEVGELLHSDRRS